DLMTVGASGRRRWRAWGRVGLAGGAGLAFVVAGTGGAAAETATLTTTAQAWYATAGPCPAVTVPGGCPAARPYPAGTVQVARRHEPHGDVGDGRRHRRGRRVGRGLAEPRAAHPARGRRRPDRRVAPGAERPDGARRRARDLGEPDARERHTDTRGVVEDRAAGSGERRNRPRPRAGTVSRRPRG